MGAGKQFDIQGAKGGSTTPKSPTEATDSLRSTNLAKLLIAVGEGEFSGTPTAKNIYLDNTPIEDASGNINFPNVKWEWRSGSVEQSYIPGIPSVENETTVNVELRNDTPWIRSITNTQLSAVRVRLAWPALQAQDDEGNVGGYRIEYAIDIATDGGAYQQVLLEAADGKNTTRYERSRRIDLPASTSGWQIRVRRITPNQNTNKIADTMLVAGLTEVIDKKLRYPNTALLYIEFDAEQFTNIPAVTVETDAKKWQVPSNYDPVNRTYSGVWDGSFKEAWTNNAAWITYGVCTEDRFGLGKRIKPFMVDKWELYRIAQYCDVAVSNGVGGLEPRFLCDMNIQGKSDAWGLLRDISAIYRGMTYWAQGQLVMQADMPRAQDFDYVFTRANVIDGKFSYGSASAKTRYTRAIVSYDNPANNYDTDVIPYADLDLQRRFGDKPVEISAIGCTRASEAQRRGKWVVLTNNLDRTVSFKTGMEGSIPLPGYIIPIADSLLAGREIGGRISAVAGRVVTLDRDTEAKAGDRLIINLPSGKAEARTVQSVAGRAVTVTTAYSEAPIAELQWAIDADDLAIPLYRVMSVKRTTEGDYEISALQYEPSKFAAIDTGARLEERPISVIPITVVPPPASVTLTANSAIDQGIAVTTMTIVWPAVAGAVGYDVEWRKDSGNWIKVQRTGNTSVDITGIYSGAYLARVRAVSAFDISSIWKSSILTQLNGKTGLPPAVTSLVTESLIFGIGIKWTFPAGAEDTQRTELWYGTAPALENATKLADLAYPQTDYTMQGLRAGQQFFFWARLVDRTGNIGPWFPVAPTVVVGQASADADAILDMLVGEITASQLGQDLLSEIGQIGGSGPGSVNERLDQVREQIEVIRGDLQGQIDDTDATLGQVKQDLLDQISDANEALTAVREELQGQIDAIADLADSMPYKPGQAYTAGQGVLGADGIIYQALQNVPVNTPPPNATYWLNVGQAVITANGLASRVQILETSVTDVKGVQTAQASQITGLQTQINDKASASALQSLTTRVTTAEGSISSQGTAITNLTSVVNGKADASALTALTTRVTAAEGVNSSQATQITNLTTTVNGKAEASAVTALTTRVTATESKNSDQDATLSSQSTAITNLTNALPGKADASAVTALTSRVTAAEGVNTSQATQITNLTTTVNGKADASTVSALSNTVTQQGTLITAQGSAITDITANLGNVGGENLLYNPSFDALATGSTLRSDGWVTSVPAGVTMAISSVASSLDPAGRAQRLDVSGMTTSTYADLTPEVLKRPAASAGQIMTLSVYVRGTAGLGFQLFLQHRNAAGTVLATASQGVSLLADGWQRITITSAAMPADTALTTPLLRVRPNTGGTITAGFVEMDRAQLEISAVASGWKDNGAKLAADTTANASATSALTARVTQTETTITSQSTQLTNLTASLSTAGGQNLLYNPSFEKAQPAAAGLADGWGINVATTAATLVASTLDPSGKAQRIDFVLANATTYVDLAPYLAQEPSVSAGQTLTMSAYVRGTVSTRIHLYFQWRNAAGTIISSDGPTSVNHTDAWQRVSRTATAPAGTVSVRLLYRFIGPGTATSVTGFMEVDRAQLEIGDTVTGWRDNGSLADSAITANASATTALTARVTQTETGLTSLSSDVTSLSNSIGNTGSDNLLPNSSFEQLGTDGIPVGWRLGSSANMAPTLTMVDSPLSSSVKAVRLTRAGLTNGSYIDLNLNLAAADRPNVVPGQSYTLSAYTRLSSPSARLAMYIQWLNTSNTVISTIQLPETAVGTTFTRSSFSGVAPAGAVKAVIFAARLLNRAGATADMWIEIDNVQFEQSATATGYSPSGASTASAQAATSTALDALTSTVTQQGATLTSVSTRATALENSVNSTTNGLATKASSSALDTLTSRVTSVEGTVTSSASRITSLESTINNGTTGLASKASSAALTSLSTTVGNQGGTITAQGNSITNLNSVVGNQGAAIQQQATAIADSAGKLSTSYVLKMGLTSDGRYYAAGFGVGLDNSTGAVQSRFIVNADQFSVLNGSADLNNGGTVTSPFIISNGQVFMSDAFIRKATITNALIGANITSQTLTSYGQPVMSTDYANGMITIQNQTTNGKYMLIRQDGIFSVSAGVVMFELQM